MKRQVPEGARVRISHGRHVDGQIGTWYRTKGSRGDLWSWVEEGHTPSCKGGHTSCELTLPNGIIVWGTADCSGRDNYSKKIGRDIALGRALARTEKLYPELFAKEKLWVG